MLLADVRETPLTPERAHPQVAPGLPRGGGCPTYVSKGHGQDRRRVGALAQGVGGAPEGLRVVSHGSALGGLAKALLTYARLFGMLSDGGMFSGPRQDFEEEQGVDLDDEEARNVEAGEFCKPISGGGGGASKRKQVHTSVGNSIARTPSAKAKRQRSN